MHSTTCGAWAIADDDSPLLSLDVTVDEIGSLNGDLDAPVVSLNVTSSDPQLYFLVTFTSGTLTLDTSSDSDDNASNDTSSDATLSWDVTGWIFSFPVNIGSLYYYRSLHKSVVDSHCNGDQYSKRR